MELTEEEKRNWHEYWTKAHRRADYTEREQKIIELSKQGKGLKEIKKEVGGESGLVNECRIKARRQGLI
jgi:DNA-binding NarL/FixJ family response regulator